MVCSNEDISASQVLRSRDKKKIIEKFRWWSLSYISTNVGESGWSACSSNSRMSIIALMAACPWATFVLGIWDFLDSTPKFGIVPQQRESSSYPLQAFQSAFNILHWMKIKLHHKRCFLSVLPRFKSFFEIGQNSLASERSYEAMAKNKGIKLYG